MSDTRNEEPGQVPASGLFHERLSFYNGFDTLGFKEWVFLPAMLYGSYEKWWGNRGKRERMHEGLDLCLYRTNEGNIKYIEENTGIPVLFNGQVVKIDNDFLGESVFIRHNDYDSNGRRLYTIYGHIKHDVHINPGEKLGDGDIIGNIAGTRKSDSPIPCHLHISIAWILNTVNTQDIGWHMIGDPTKVILLDPLNVIKCPHSIVSNI